MTRARRRPAVRDTGMTGGKQHTARRAPLWGGVFLCHVVPIRSPLCYTYRHATALRERWQLVGSRGGGVR